MRVWNVLATSLEGRREPLLVALRRLGPFWRAGYRNVVVGRVDEMRGFLETISERLTDDLLLAASLTKIVPIDRLSVFEPTDLVDTVVTMLTEDADRVAGHSFFVRLERRGLKGVVHTPSIERSVGAALVTLSAARGAAARVTFDDPDVVVAIETTGSTVGIGLLTRELRQAFPFIRVR